MHCSINLNSVRYITFFPGVLFGLYSLFLHFLPLCFGFCALHKHPPLQVFIEWSCWQKWISLTQGADGLPNRRISEHLVQADWKLDSQPLLEKYAAKPLLGRKWEVGIFASSLYAGLRCRVWKWCFSIHYTRFWACYNSVGLVKANLTGYQS